MHSNRSPGYTNRDGLGAGARRVIVISDYERDVVIARGNEGMIG